MGQNKKITVIGGGRIGQTVAQLIRQGKKTDVFVWDLDPEKSHPTSVVSEAVSGASVLFLCVPSWALRSVIKEIKKYTQKETLFVSFAKGIESGTHNRADEIMQQELRGYPIAIFSGPFMAEELDKGLYGIGIIGTKNKKDFVRVSDLFSGTHAKLHWVSDIKSAAVAGILKNIYAVGLGIADGLNWGTNAKGWLLAQIYNEMIQVGIYLGADRDIIFLAGGSDLITSGFSPYSRNRRSGEQILAGRTRFIKSESLATYPSLQKIFGKNLKKFPLLSLFGEIVAGKKDAKKEFEKLL